MIYCLQLQSGNNLVLGEMAFPVLSHGCCVCALQLHFLTPHPTPCCPAPQLQSGDNLVLGEMVFGGAFGGLTSEQIAALCSCFVWSERSEGGAK